MQKFLVLMRLMALTSSLTEKHLDDLEWEDLFTLFADKEWIAAFEELYEMF